MEDCKNACNDDETCEGIEYSEGSALGCHTCKGHHHTLTSTNSSIRLQNVITSVYVKVPMNSVTLENCEKGLKVRRGRDWFYDNQDSEDYGTITNCKNNDWADVEWTNVNNSYPIGADGIYALNTNKVQPKFNTMAWLKLFLYSLVNYGSSGKNIDAIMEQEQ